MYIPKFSVGDRFRVIANGITGKIIRKKFDLNTSKGQYVVLWDHFSRGVDYPFEEADQLWESNNCDLESVLKLVTYDDTHIKLYNPFKSCDHEYVSYQGLNESFEYCKKCDGRK